MPRFPLVLAGAIVSVFVAGCAEEPEVPAGPVDLTAVSAKELDAAIASHKGKVVLVDCWYLACGPCVKKFPNLVALHKKYSKDGLVCISVDVFPEELERKDQVLEFLKKKGAVFPNYILKDDKNNEEWQKPHGIEFTPWLILFDKSGKPSNVPEKASPEDVDELVKKALKVG